MTSDLLHALLRSPKDISERCRDDSQLQALALLSFAAVIAGAAVFGGVLGSHRGGIQILYSAVKLPLAWFATLVVCTPAFYAVALAFGRPWPLRHLVALVLATTARAALALLALSPVLWLWIDTGASYRGAALGAAVAYALCGLAGLFVLVRGASTLGKSSGLVLTATFVVLFGLAGGQTAWSLRPYLGRPAQADVPFVRSPEGGFAGSLTKSLDSMRRGVR